MEECVQSSAKASGWTYTEIVVHDHNRVLKPTHLCSSEIVFSEAPRLGCSTVSICVINGDRQTTRTARVLPHEPESKRIPIRLIVAQEEAPKKLTA